MGADKGNTEESEVGSCHTKWLAKAFLAKQRRTVVVLAVTAEVDGDLFGLRQLLASTSAGSRSDAPGRQSAWPGCCWDLCGVSVCGGGGDSRLTMAPNIVWGVGG